MHLKITGPKSSSSRRLQDNISLICGSQTSPAKQNKSSQLSKKGWQGLLRVTQWRFWKGWSLIIHVGRGVWGPIFTWILMQPFSLKDLMLSGSSVWRRAFWFCSNFNSEFKIKGSMQLGDRTGTQHVWAPSSVSSTKKEEREEREG